MGQALIGPDIRGPAPQFMTRPSFPDIDVDPSPVISWYAMKSRPGWLMVRSDPDTIKMIRASGVQQDPMMASKDQICVPVWVKDAINAYRNNEGYADMNIGEFLKKVGGDFKAKK